MLQALFLAARLLASRPAACACLPEDVTCDELVASATTVAQELTAVRARCIKGTLVDGSGKAVRFYRLTGCWGNPPEDYQEILRQQELELAKLRKRYRVIEIGCNPSGAQVSLMR